MARIARVVAPGLPHHITQRGNRRQQIFFADEDYLAYLDLMAICGRNGSPPLSWMKNICWRRPGTSK
jgi:putative transposase